MISQIAVNSLALGSIYALVAVGFGLIYGAVRFFHFAHAVVYSAGAYVAFTVAVSAGLGWWWGMAAGVLGACIFGNSMNIAVYRPLRRRDASGTVMFIASLGLLIFFQNLISITYGDTVLVLRREAEPRIYELLGARASNYQIEIVLLAIVVFAGLWALLRYSNIGWSLRAVADDPGLARAKGLPVELLRTFVFVLGSGMAGLAGVFAANETDIRPTMGLPVLLMAVVAVIVGGTGNIAGQISGAYLVAFIFNVSGYLLPGQWNQAVIFMLFAVFLLFRPQGIAGRESRNQALPSE